MADIKGLYSGILTSLHREPPYTTMAKKLIINVAPTGSFTSGSKMTCRFPGPTLPVYR